MKSIAICLLALGAAAPTGPAEPAADGFVRLGGRPYAVDELPEDLGEAPRVAVRAWTAWADEHEYELDLEADGRVLLVTPTGSRKRDKIRRKAAKVVKRFDELLPAPTTTGDDGVATDWGAGSTPLDRDTAVLFVLRDPKDQRLLLDELAQRHDYLAAWTKGAKNHIGFVLEQPLLGAYLEDAPILDEWRAENELVHRLTELLFLRRFGRQPWWIQQGVAWNVELDLEKGLYCFPYRSEFIYAVEHDAWPDSVKGLYKRKGKDVKPLDLALLSSWNRGSFHAQSAWTAFGATNYLLAEHDDSFPLLLRDLLRHRLENGRVDNGDGTWQLVVGYEIPADELRAMLEARCGEDVLEEAGTYLGKGKAK